MKKILIPLLVTVFSVLLAGMASAIDIPAIPTAVPAFVGAVTPNAGGVQLVPGGRGDALLGTFYDVRTIADSNIPVPTEYPQFTLINIVNTDTAYGVIARIRFREWKRSDEVLDFDIPLSCNDVWVAELSRLETGGGILHSPDLWVSGAPTTNYFPSATIPEAGLPFRTFQIADSVTLTTEEKLARTEYGYFELIGEERVECKPTSSGSWIRLTQGLRDVPDVLMGTVYLVRPNIAISHQYNMEALGAFSVAGTGIWDRPQSGRPNLYQDVNPTGGFDQLEANLSKRYVMFQYVDGVDETSTPRSTSVVVTFPTKHFHYGSDFHQPGVAGWSPFAGYHETPLDGTNGGEVFAYAVFDRAENVFAPPDIPISPPPPGIPAEVLPYEVNVIGMLPEDPLPAEVYFRNNLLIPTANVSTGDSFIEGWMAFDLSPDLGLIGTDPRLEAGFAPGRSQGETGITFSWFNNTFTQYRGLPAIGIVMTEFFNGDVNGYYGNTVVPQYAVAFGEAPDVIGTAP